MKKKMITERQSQILNSIIREYISSASPVSSQLIEQNYDFGLCPASIRSEMQKMTEEGYLFQPHTSSGRVPTDKGYRFFVDNLLEETIPRPKAISGLENLFEEIEDIFKFASQLTKFLAEASCNLTILRLWERDLFWKEGWEEILREPEFENKGFTSSFTNFLRDFEGKIDDLQINSGIKIYIGRENPLSKEKDFSIILSRCPLPAEKEGIVSLLGPKRMDYDKNIRLINSLEKLLEKF